MIFTSCTYCNDTIIYSYEASDHDFGCFDKQKCENCGKYNFIERSSFGETLSEEDFWEKHPEAKPNSPAEK